MPYTIYKNQDRVSEGKTRFKFEARIDGRRYRKTAVCQKSAVRKIFRDWESLILSGVIELRDFKLFESLNKYLDYAAEHKTEKQCQVETRVVRLLQTFFQDMPLLNFKRYHVEDFIQWRRKSPIKNHKTVISTITVNREISVISYFFNWAIVRGLYTGINPAFKLKFQESDRDVRLTSEQTGELLEKARKQGREIYSAVLVALLTGLRQGELLGLKWSDVDFKDSTIHLSAEVTKSGKRRVVAMPDFLRAHLAEVRKENPFHDKVFVWSNNDQFRVHWERLRDTLSFKTLSNGLIIRWHDLRHCYAQALRDSGVSLDDISCYLGHSSVQITERRYAQHGGHGAREKVNKIGAVIPLKAIV